MAAQDTGATPPVPTNRNGGSATPTPTPTSSTPATPSAPASSPSPATKPIAAAQVFINMFEALGMADLGKQIASMFTDPTMTMDDIEYKIYELPAYKAMFPGMDQLRKNGGGASGITSEAQYLQQRAVYQTVLKNNNLPQGFYDSPQDFADWMVNGVSPNELNQRITQAKKVVDSADPAYAAQALDYYGLDRSHLMAYVLDPNRAQPLIDRQMKAIDMGAAASRNGIGLNVNQAEGLVNDGYLTGGIDQMNNAFASTADLFKNDSKLANIEGGLFTQADAVDAVIKNNIDAQRKAQALAQREQARFSGANAGKGQFARAGGSSI